MNKFSKAVAAGMLSVAVAGGAVAFLGGPLVSTAQAHLRDHPKLEAAYNALKEAKEYLDTSKDDFRGRKVEAVKAIDHAMHQIALCVDEAEKRSVVEQQPQPLARNHEKLHIALENLKAAREYLHEAKSDFHGHKEEAIKGIDEAIHELDRLLQ